MFAIVTYSIMFEYASVSVRPIANMPLVLEEHPAPFPEVVDKSPKSEALPVVPKTI